MVSRLTSWELGLKNSLAHLPISDWNVVCYQEVESTMDVARDNLDLATQGALLVLAEKQTAGRGRYGKKWEQADSALYSTFVFPIPDPNFIPWSFSLVTGVVIHEVLSAANSEIDLKWPNDFISKDGRKLGGILVERYKHSDRYFVAIGIGVNLKGQVLGVGNTVSLFELTGRVYHPIELLEGIAPRLSAAWQDYIEHGFVFYKERYELASLSLGSIISVNVDSEKVSGIYKGVDKEGCLILEVDGEEKVLHTASLAEEEQDIEKEIK